MLKDLYEEPIETDFSEKPLETVLDVRTSLIVIEQQTRKVEKTKETKRAVLDAYDAQIAAGENAIERERERVREYLERAGENVVLPDVGTAYLRNVDEKVNVVDVEQVPDDLKKAFTTTKRTDVLDVAGLKKHVLDRVKETGEIPAGFELVPASRELSIRKAG